jgi:hypothetical protein
MQLKIQRSQRASITSKIIFCLDVRADYTPEEQSNIQKYRLGGQAIYNSRAAKKHLENADANFASGADRGGGLASQTAGLAKGALSFALAKMQLNVTIASLGKGHHIECKDLKELLEAEDTLRGACKELTRYLEVAATFDGSELVVEYERGEEKVRIDQHVPPLLSAPESAQQAERANDTMDDDEDFGFIAQVREFLANPVKRKFAMATGALLVVAVLLYSCS